MAFDPLSEVGRAYLDYVENRARIWAEKYIDGREPDYHGDEVLHRYHFCNVWRELDRYSRWEIAQIRGKPLARQLDLIVVGRMAMVPATVRLLLRGATRDELIAHRDARRAAGLPWYNSAIKIPGGGGFMPGNWRSYGYVEAFIQHRDSYLREKDDILRVLRRSIDAAEVISAIKAVTFVGPFKSYEVATSLTYSDRLPALREEQLFHVGPGAAGGLWLLTGSTSSNRSDFEALRVAVMKSLSRSRLFRWIPPEWQARQPGEQRKFTLRTLEDTLCEFRKYWNIKIGSARGRRGYHRRDICA